MGGANLTRQCLINNILTTTYLYCFSISKFMSEVTPYIPRYKESGKENIRFPFLSSKHFIYPSRGVASRCTHQYITYHSTSHQKASIGRGQESQTRKHYITTTRERICYYRAVYQSVFFYFI